VRPSSFVQVAGKGLPELASRRSPMSIMINNIGQSSAMDGRNVIATLKSTFALGRVEKDTEVNAEAADVAQDLEKTESQVRRIQDYADFVGSKIQFRVNEDLGKVIVKIVDPQTDKVIKEIPSADVQNLQLRLKEALGLLIDEKI